MVDAFIRLVCPECNKEWQDNPARNYRASVRTSAVPDCHATRRLTEFMRTERDLEAVKQFQ